MYLDDFNNFLKISFQHFAIVAPTADDKGTENSMSLLKFFAIVSIFE